MKENMTLILLVFSLALVLWLGVRIFFDPGKPAPWVPALVEASKPKKETQLAKPASEPSTAKRKSSSDSTQSDPQNSSRGTAEAGFQNPGEPDILAAQPLQQGEFAESALKLSTAERASSFVGTKSDPQYSFQGNAEALFQNPSEPDILVAPPLAQGGFAKAAPQPSTSERESSFVSMESDPHNFSRGTAVADFQNQGEPDILAAQTLEQGVNQRVERGAAVGYSAGNTSCAKQYEQLWPVDILFREATAAIKGSSLTQLNSVAALYHQCGRGMIKIDIVNVRGKTAKALQRRRLDEVKYHLQHLRVSRADLLLPEKQ